MLLASLDFTGSLTLGDEAEAAAGEGEGPKPKRVIPLAHVGGTLDAPEVRIRPADAFRVATGLRPDKVEELSDKIDEKFQQYQFFLLLVLVQ